MKALIIGASGFVGPYLVEEIRKSLFCEVIATTSRELDKLGIGEDKTVHLDICDKEQISRILLSEKPDYIFIWQPRVQLLCHGEIQNPQLIPTLSELSI